MRILASISLLFLIGCNSRAQTDKEKLDSIFGLALKADSIGDYKTSILYYNKILEIDSLNMGALVNRGRALISASRIQDGFVDLNKAIIHYPHERTYFARGVAYMFHNQLDSAKKDFKTTIKLNPLFADAYYALSNLYFVEKNYFNSLYYCDLADKYRMNKNISTDLKAEMSKTFGNDVVANFNYDKIIRTTRNLPIVKNDEQKSIAENKHGFTYDVKMEKSSNWLYIITVHDGEADKTRWAFKMDAATLKVLNLNGEN